MPGAPYLTQVGKAIEECGAFVLIVSPISLGIQSGHPDGHRARLAKELPPRSLVSQGERRFDLKRLEKDAPFFMSKSTPTPDRAPRKVLKM